MKPEGCSRENYLFRHVPATKGTAMVNVAAPKAKVEPKAKAEPAAGGKPSNNKLRAANRAAKAAQALVASIKEQLKAAQ